MTNLEGQPPPPLERQVETTLTEATRTAEVPTTTCAIPSEPEVMPVLDVSRQPSLGVQSQPEDEMPPQTFIAEPEQLVPESHASSSVLPPEATGVPLPKNADEGLCARSEYESILLACEELIPGESANIVWDFTQVDPAIQAQDHSHSADVSSCCLAEDGFPLLESPDAFRGRGVLSGNSLNPKRLG